MTVYADSFALLNFALCCLQLLLTEKVYNGKTTYFKIALGGVLGTVYSFSCFFVDAVCLKFIVPAAIVAVVFKFNGVIDYLRTVIVFYIIVFVFGGCAYALKNSAGVGIVLISSAAAYAILSLFVRFYRRVCVQKNAIVNVAMNVSNTTVTFKGLVDTGNSLVDPYTRLPVMVVYEKTVPLCETRLFRLVPYNTVSDECGFIKVFTPQRVEINEKVVRCAVGICGHRLSNDGAYDAVVNPQII